MFTIKPLASLSPLPAAFGRQEAFGLRCAAAAAAAAAVLPLETRHVKLTLAAIIIHEPNLPENSALRPTHVVNAQDGPREPDVSVGVAPV